jgi:hypothetical protein
MGSHKAVAKSLSLADWLSVEQLRIGGVPPQAPVKTASPAPPTVSLPGSPAVVDPQQQELKVKFFFGFSRGERSLRPPSRSAAGGRGGPTREKSTRNRPRTPAGVSVNISPARRYDGQGK